MASTPTHPSRAEPVDRLREHALPDPARSCVAVDVDTFDDSDLFAGTNGRGGRDEVAELDVVQAAEPHPTRGVRPVGVQFGELGRVPLEVHQPAARGPEVGEGLLAEPAEGCDVGRSRRTARTRAG